MLEYWRVSSLKNLLKTWRVTTVFQLRCWRFQTVFNSFRKETTKFEPRILFVV